MKTYTAIFERAADGGWSAHVPDLPTILVGADTFDLAKEKLQEAIQLHIEDLKLARHKKGPSEEGHKATSQLLLWAELIRSLALSQKLRCPILLTSHE
jgi:predicted RNase H-like HicB family nuclease